MLRLLPNVLYSKTSERKSFLIHIFLFVLSVHVIFFGSMILCSIMGKKQDKFTILMHQTGATYVLMPLQKKVDQNGTYDGNGSSKKSQVIAYDEYFERKKNSKKVHHKNSTSKQSVSKKREEVLKGKKNKSKATAVLADKKYTSKKLKNKKQSLKKTKKQKKNKIKIVERLQDTASTALEQKAAAVQEQQPPQVSSEIVQELQDVQQSSDTTLSPISDTIVFVGYEQFDECVIGSKIQQAIVQNWTPPVGLGQGISCEMKIAVSADGAADAIDIIKGSGILVFDMSARTALQQIEFPQEVHGKTIMIVLGN